MYFLFIDRHKSEEAKSYLSEYWLKMEARSRDKLEVTFVCGVVWYVYVCVCALVGAVWFCAFSLI